MRFACSAAVLASALDCRSVLLIFGEWSVYNILLRLRWSL